MAMIVGMGPIMSPVTESKIDLESKTRPRLQSPGREHQNNADKAYHNTK